MKKLIATFILLGLCQLTSAQNVYIPDSIFKSLLLKELTVDSNNDGIGDMDADENNDGEIDQVEATKIQFLIFSGLFSDLTGIDKFVNLKKIKFPYCKVSNLNLTNYEKLESISIIFNQTKNIELNSLPALVELIDLGSAGFLETLKLTNLPKLIQINAKLIINYCYVDNLPALLYSK
ncbi:MAG: hypothetical protein IPH36_20395 [Saprospiraceae bacterium]|nr:hypothetical protein [Saprospiraceae bacterium]